MGRKLASGISDEKKLYIAEMLEKGCTYRQISQDLGVSNQTIADAKREFFGGDDMQRSIVAGDKFNGLLECVGKNQFKGSVRVKGGKFKTKRFTTASRQEAEKLWNEWKEEILKNEAPVIDNPPLIAARGNNKHSYVPNTTDSNSTPIKRSYISTETPNLIEIPKKEETENEEEFRPIYLLTVGEPRIAGYSYDEAQARKMMDLLNYALETADVDVRYSVIQVSPKNADVIGVQS